MPREWTGSVFQTRGRKTYTTKWKDYQTDTWKLTKGFHSKAEANDFLADKRREYRERSRGLHDPYEEHRRRPVQKHLDEFIEHVKSGRRRRTGKRNEKHPKQVATRLRTAMTAMSVRTLADLTLDKTTRYLNKLVDDDGLATKTRNDYGASLKQFGRWLEDSQRLLKNPLAAIQSIDDPDGAKKRQALEWKQVRQLAAAAIQRLLQRSPRKSLEKNLAIGKRRALTVITAFLTGLRNSELAHMEWGWINFEDSEITVPHTVTKSGRTEQIPLHRGLADLLTLERRRRSIAAGRSVTNSELVVGHVINGVAKLPRNLPERIRDDAKWVGLAVVDENGDKLDLHAMRTSFGNQLDMLGVPEAITADLMRHKPQKVTRSNYLKRRNAMMLPFINEIPAEAAHVPGLHEEPAATPNQVRPDAHVSAPKTIKKAE